MKFIELGLNDSLVSAVEKNGYTESTPIQAQAIPKILAGKNYGPSFSIAKDFTEWDESFFIAQDKYCVEDKVFDYTTD